MLKLTNVDALKMELQSHFDVVEQDCSTSDEYREGVVAGLDAAMFEIDSAPIIDAIPVEWLKAQIAPYIGDVSDIGRSVRNGTIKELLRKWQKEKDTRVYPTWWEWLASIGAVTRKVKPDVASELIETGLLDPIPADIAQKLGIEPKGDA